MGPPPDLRRSGHEQCTGCDCSTCGVPASRIFLGHLALSFTAGLCNARIVALMLDVIGPEGRDASTWYCALLSAGNIPVASMIWLEGLSFHRFGTHGLLWTDAGANVIVFAIVALAFLTRGFSLARSRTVSG